METKRNVTSWRAKQLLLTLGPSCCGAEFKHHILHNTREQKIFSCLFLNLYNKLKHVPVLKILLDQRKSLLSFLTTLYLKMNRLQWFSSDSRVKIVVYISRFWSSVHKKSEYLALICRDQSIFFLQVLQEEENAENALISAFWINTRQTTSAFKCLLKTHLDSLTFNLIWFSI